MAENEIKQRIDDLHKRWNRVNQKKAGLEGQLQAKKDELKRVVREIEEAGYDPKHIAQERDQAKAELETMISKLESELDHVEEALSSYDK